MTYSLTWLADVLVAAGLKVAEQPDWTTRGLGDVGPTKGVLCHHTAGPATGNMPSLGVVTNGRGGQHPLRGPLSQLCLGRDGGFYVVAAGLANHAGAGNWKGITTGNTNFIGIEAENTGLPSDPWPAVQMDAYARGVAAILKKIGADQSMCVGHKEYALPPGRKTDPWFDMDDFRAKVGAILADPNYQPVMIPASNGQGRSTIRRGATGDPVRLLQQAIGIPVDGIFGPGTEAALRIFQSQHGLVPDGIAGPKTWALIPG